MGAIGFLLIIDELTPGLWRGLYRFSIQSNDAWSDCSFSNELFGLNGPGQLTIPFSRFQGADFTHVQTIKIDMARFEPTFRIGIDSIMTVPEPGALALLLTSLLGALAYVWRKRP